MMEALNEKADDLLGLDDGYGKMHEQNAIGFLKYKNTSNALEKAANSIVKETSKTTQNNSNTQLNGSLMKAATDLSKEVIKK